MSEDQLKELDTLKEVCRKQGQASAFLCASKVLNEAAKENLKNGDVLTSFQFLRQSQKMLVRSLNVFHETVSTEQG